MNWLGLTDEEFIAQAQACERVEEAELVRNPRFPVIQEPHRTDRVNCAECQGSPIDLEDVRHVTIEMQGAGARMIENALAAEHKIQASRPQHSQVGSSTSQRTTAMLEILTENLVIRRPLASGTYRNSPYYDGKAEHFGQ